MSTTVGLGTNQKKEPIAGPPFVAAAANNGLSIDTVSGKIVLGNNVGQAGNPAILLNNREIFTSKAAPGPTGPFNIQLTDNRRNALTTMNGNTIAIVSSGAFQGAAINVTSAGAATAGIALQSAGGNCTLAVGNNADIFRISPDGGGHIQFLIGGTFTNIWSINTATFNTQVGNPTGADNGATFQITGTCTYRYFTVGVTGAVAVDRDLDSGKMFFNSGATTLNLPNMAGANFRPGFCVLATVDNAAGIVFQMGAGQTLRFGAAASTVAGTLTSVTVGSTVRIVLIASGTWVTESFTGVWVPA